MFIFEQTSPLQPPGGAGGRNRSATSFHPPSVTRHVESKYLIKALHYTFENSFASKCVGRFLKVTLSLPPALKECQPLQQSQKSEESNFFKDCHETFKCYFSHKSHSILCVKRVITQVVISLGVWEGTEEAKPQLRVNPRVTSGVGGCLVEDAPGKAWADGGSGRLLAVCLIARLFPFLPTGRSFLPQQRL